MSTIQKIQSKLKREFIYKARDIKYTAGIYNNFYKNARGSRIMIYHGICLSNHALFNPIFLQLKTFEEHLKFYKKHFNVLSLDDYYQQKFNSDKFNICLTFDDGFANNYKYVLPLLSKYQLPATFFVTAIRDIGYDILWNDFLTIVSKYGPQQINLNGETYFKGKYDKYYSTETNESLVNQLRRTGFAEKAAMMNLLYFLYSFKTDKTLTDYWLQMTEAHIKELSQSPYATIGSHGYYHNDLSQISIGDAAEELTYSKQYLENLIQKPVNSFAFPYGAYTPQVIEEAKKIGYNQLLAMDFHNKNDNSDLTMRERFTVNPFISTQNQMYATITRRYEH
jgi:peptidoglycan/xylan/chitin deacetylase (PgdA/CDA1 family)